MFAGCNLSNLIRSGRLSPGGAVLSLRKLLELQLSRYSIDHPRTHLNLCSPIYISGFSKSAGVARDYKR